MVDTGKQAGALYGRANPANLMAPHPIGCFESKPGQHGMAIFGRTAAAQRLGFPEAYDPKLALCTSGTDNG